MENHLFIVDLFVFLVDRSVRLFVVAVIVAVVVAVVVYVYPSCCACHQWQYIKPYARSCFVAASS